MDEFERALARGLREGDADGARAEVFVAPARPEFDLVRWGAAFAVLAAAGAVLSLGYVAASRVLPPVVDVLSALMWAPVGLAALVVLAAAREALRALG